MTPRFADTFFFLALLNARDPLYERARELNRVDHPVLTSWWVLIELADHLCDSNNRKLFGQVIDALETDNRYEIVPADQKVLAPATLLYRQHRDKEWSLTDCTSFILMRKRKIIDALTGDHHFEQAGFRLLLK